MWRSLENFQQFVQSVLRRLGSDTGVDTSLNMNPNRVAFLQEDAQPLMWTKMLSSFCSWYILPMMPWFHLVLLPESKIRTPNPEP